MIKSDRLEKTNVNKNLCLKEIQQTTVQEKHTVVKGNKIRYLEEGESDNTIILLHGLGGYAERWSNTIPKLSSRYKVIALDLIGHGQSDKPQVDFTPEFFRDSVLDFMESVSISNAFLIGNSLGGEIVAECAASQRSSIKKIVMVSPAGIMKRSTPVLDAYIMAALYPTHESVKMAYQMMSGDSKEISEQTVQTFISNMTLPNAKMVFLSTLLGMKNSPPVTDKLRFINVPTLLIWGGEDKMIPIEYSKEFVSSIPNCDFVIMNGCGHAPFEENSEEFANIVLEFLRKDAKNSHSQQ